MRALTPWTWTTAPRRDLDRWFERFFDAPWTEAPTTMGEWAPPMDVAEGKDAVTVTAELPGVDPKEIAVTLEGDILTLKGEKEEETTDERRHRTERTWGMFMRTLRLPAPVDASKVTATFKNGVMTITLPKTAGTKGTLIPVKAE
ncbi:MAG TPA: Hsp20/alpha crystallin family protein [Candidatus Binatia bacterium]|nr:Hsp20/alpha crystallin family protein [Candidatus Binatia bacterium]